MTDRPAVPRLVPDAPLPPYSYVPGAGLPHPISDPAGHRFGHRPAPAAPLDPARWRESRPFLLGIDLLNHQFFWEAHEAWEPLWHAGGRAGPVADFLKGLIKLAAAGVKHREGMPRGVATHARRAADLWRSVARSLDDDGPFAGLRLPGLIALADGIADAGWPDSPVLLRPGPEGDRP